MKIEIIKDEKLGKVGYKLIPETPQEAKDLNFVRNVSFFGSFEYDGRERNENFPDDAGNLKWIAKK